MAPAPPDLELLVRPARGPVPVRVAESKTGSGSEASNFAGNGATLSRPNPGTRDQRSLGTSSGESLGWIFPAIMIASLLVIGGLRLGGRLGSGDSIATRQGTVAPRHCASGHRLLMNRRLGGLGGYLLQILLMPLPWRVRRWALEEIFGFEISPSARVGFSIVAPSFLRLATNSSIGHLNFVRGMELIDLGEGALIGPLNWIYGISARELSSTDGTSALILGEGACITGRHMIDCSAPISLGKFSLVAGYGSQMLTHSVDLVKNRQGAKAIGIGDYALVGTRSVVLGGATLPGYSALGAGSTLRHDYQGEYTIYAGVPAKRVAETDPTADFFHRTEARVR